MDAAIIVDSLSKSYLLRHRQEQAPAYRTLREALLQGAARVGQLMRNGRVGAGESEEQFWALRNVSFRVDPGERVGIIGRNGAGKSTLLKLLSRITSPTEGSIRIRGRLSSLLEVGTGFHPELTGRENIFLNGAILGMSRQEVRKKFDQIVDFAETERFLDTPVKRYSSGMYVRLAFAIAAHLDPDVLILDEVLAVGDFRFQRKCFEKIKEIGGESGRAVIIVSHNMSSVRSLCSRALLLDMGGIAAIGGVDEVIGAYECAAMPKGTFGRVSLADWKNRTGKNREAIIEWAEVNLEGANLDATAVYVGSSIRIGFSVNFQKSLIGKRAKFAVQLRTVDGVPIANMVDEDSGINVDSVRSHEVLSLVLRDLRLYPGTYLMSLWVGSADSETWDWVHDGISIEVVEGGPVARRRLPRDAGLLFLTPEWKRL